MTRTRTRGARLSVAIASAGILTIVCLFNAFAPAYNLYSAATCLVLWIIIATLMLTTLRFHPHKTFGWANHVTTFRAASSVLLAGFIPVAAQIPPASVWLWVIAVVTTITLCLDGLDGYMARKTQLSSVYGARFDMETDALLGLVITAFIWQSGKLGFWILGLGVMRYAFLAGSLFFVQLRAPLFPSLRRKAVCVIQVAALCLILCPWIKADAAAAIGAAAMAILLWSFLVDISWLFNNHQRRACNAHSTSPGIHPNNETNA